MIISHRHRFVYIKTRKTASTSVEIALSRLCGPHDVITAITAKDQALRSSLGYPGPQNEFVRSGNGETFRLMNHDSASVAQDVLGDKWDEYFTFTLERNPFDKAISQFFWRTGNNLEEMDLTQFLRRSEPGRLSNWGLYAEGDRVLVDYVGKYESLEASLAYVADRIGLGAVISLPEVKAKSQFRTDHRHYREVLTDEDRRTIERVCSRELAAFGYAW